MSTRTTIQTPRRNPHPGDRADTISWRADAEGASASVGDLLSVKDVESLRPGSGLLVVTRGPDTGAQVRLDRPS